MTAIGICAKIGSKRALEAAASTARSMSKRGFQVNFDLSTAHALHLDQAREFTKPELAPSSDYLIVFGGDGTLLSVARHAPPHVPVIGVNMGTLGFITEIRAKEYEKVLDDVLDGNYTHEDRVTMDVSVSGPNGELRYRVLNDAVINKGALARIVTMTVDVGGHFVSTFRSDGLIVCTPTGSTAYNLSAGGPIIYPTMKAVVITPICPHMLTNRPIVLSDDQPIDIKLVSPVREVFLTLDGQEGIALHGSERIHISKAAATIRIVQSPDKNYFDVLRNKLKWGEGK
jgi:NAD+ kinase